MYFRSIPDIQYDTKPVNYPFTSSDFIVAKNFFRRFQLNPDVFDFALLYDQTTVEDGERLDQVAYRMHGKAEYDWIIVLVNNLIDPQFNWPMSDNVLRKYAEEKYDDPYSEILYYETQEIRVNQKIKTDLSSVDTFVTVLEGGQRVSRQFYNDLFTYFDGTNTLSVPGSSVSRAITAFEHEQRENDDRRTIYTLRNDLITRFVEEFRGKNAYGKSSDYISNKLKKTGV